MALGSTSVTALSRETLRNQMKTSMMGRRAGMDNNDYEVGEQDTRLPIDNITSTVPTSLSPNGASLFSCTVASSAIHTLQNPVAGIYKQLTQISSSTLGIAVQFGPGAQLITTQGTSFNQLIFAGFGHTANLFCVATGSSVGGVGGIFLVTAAFTTASGMQASTY
jgi:hypothetical protein